MSKYQKGTLDEDVMAENIRVVDGCAEEIIVLGLRGSASLILVSAPFLSSKPSIISRSALASVIASRYSAPTETAKLRPLRV